MSTRNNLTGSQDLREYEILNKWLSFEPLSNEEYAISGVLYTVPLGQYFSPTLNIISGSYTSTSGTIQIEKDIHLFELEQDATKFISDIGIENVALVRDSNVDGVRWIEVHLLNHTDLEFSFDVEDLNEQYGYKLEVLRSSSFGYEKIPREVLSREDGRIISDTYLKYFDLLPDR